MANASELDKILALMPQRIAAVVKRTADSMNGGSINEIRLRIDRPVSLTADEDNIILPIRITESELKGALLALTDGSPYAYSSAIEKGYIPQKNGVRCGVCPVKGAKGSLDHVTSICLRIPFVGKVGADTAELCKKDGRVISTLLYSPPGVGKTTVLRMLIKNLCSGEKALRGAVIDSRGELCTKATSADTLTDFLSGYEKGEGIELAVRSLSPQVVFCDEIGSRDDAEALLGATNTGVPIIASAHADSLDSLFRRVQIAKLRDNSVFLRYIGITRSKNEYKFDITDI